MTVEWIEQPPTEIYGGDVFNFSSESTNNANRDIEVHYQLTTVNGDNSWGGSEIEKIELFSGGNWTDVTNNMYFLRTDGTYDLFTSVGSEGSNELRLMLDHDGNTVLETYTHPAGYTAQSNVRVTMNENVAPGTYSINICYLFDLTGDCN